jgi:hypothetical protein
MYQLQLSVENRIKRRYRKRKKAHATWQQQKLRKKGSLSRFFFGLAFMQILADFSSCFALGLLLQQWVVRTDAEDAFPTAMIWGYTITACGFLLLFGPASIVASFRRAGQAAATPTTEDARHCARCRRQWHQVTDAFYRVLAGCFGGAMLLGLVYIAVGAALLAGGNDMRCWAYTGTTEREWNTKCGWPERGHCAVGACVCKEWPEPRDRC